jgi:hypothetical protein
LNSTFGDIHVSVFEYFLKAVFEYLPASLTLKTDVISLSGDPLNSQAYLISPSVFVFPLKK